MPVSVRQFYRNYSSLYAAREGMFISPRKNTLLVLLFLYYFLRSWTFALSNENGKNSLRRLESQLVPCLKYFVYGIQTSVIFLIVTVLESKYILRCAKIPASPLPACYPTISWAISLHEIVEKVYTNSLTIIFISNIFLLDGKYFFHTVFLTKQTNNKMHYKPTIFPKYRTVYGAFDANNILCPSSL